VGETLTYAYADEGVDVRVARIFNTYGPRMNEEDGRVVSNFIIQALKEEDITIYGSGNQTRSFQYVHDLVDGLIQLMESEYTLPVNIGTPYEYTINDFARLICSTVESKSQISYLPALQDDPKQRKPDISTAEKHLKWKPRFSVNQGLEETIEYFKSRMIK
jgi:UDP-glucuronate decarboxylase